MNKYIFLMILQISLCYVSPVYSRIFFEPWFRLNVNRGCFETVRNDQEEIYYEPEAEEEYGDECGDVCVSDDCIYAPFVEFPMPVPATQNQLHELVKPKPAYLTVPSQPSINPSANSNELESNSFYYFPTYINTNPRFDRTPSIRGPATRPIRPLPENREYYRSPANQPLNNDYRRLNPSYPPNIPSNQPTYQGIYQDVPNINRSNELEHDIQQNQNSQSLDQRSENSEQKKPQGNGVGVTS